jgi:hypothetical protein
VGEAEVTAVAVATMAIEVVEAAATVEVIVAAVEVSAIVVDVEATRSALAAVDPTKVPPSTWRELC